MIEGFGGGHGRSDECEGGGSGDEGGAPARASDGADHRYDPILLLLGQLLVQARDELFVWGCLAGTGCPQLDRGAQDCRVFGIGPKATRASPGRERIKKGGHLSAAHWSSSIPTFVAMRRARCWRTLALVTLISMARAASLIEDASRNRSSRIRRQRSGRAASSRAARFLPTRAYIRR